MKLLDANTEGKFAMHLPETAEPETGPATVARSSTQDWEMEQLVPCIRFHIYQVRTGTPSRWITLALQIHSYNQEHMF
jgi:hypothetical protein